MDVVVWLRSLGLGKYEAAFRDNEIDENGSSELNRDLGVGPGGHRRRGNGQIGGSNVVWDDGKAGSHSAPACDVWKSPPALAYVRPGFVWEMSVRHYSFSRENIMKKISVIGATLVGAAILCAAPVSLHWSQDKTLSVTQDDAYARVGRPLTPGCVAGVARRTARRHCAAGVCRYY